jgi:hypothetical protein
LPGRRWNDRGRTRAAIFTASRLLSGEIHVFRFPVF